jgi:hypothetical protein
MDTPFRAAFMSADTGGSATYEFQADSDLFHQSADEIVGTFMARMNDRLDWERPLSYELNSAVKKADKKVVLAAGSLVLEKGELPFLLMISPERRPTAAAAEPS